MTNEMISISTSQNFRSWVVIFHLLQPIAFLSLSLYDTPRLAPRMNILLWGQGDFPVSCSNRDTSWNAWNLHSRSFMVDTEIFFRNVKSPSHECRVVYENDILTLGQWLISQPIRLSTNFMTLIPSLTFAELRVVSMEHLQRVWHASRERLPLQTPGSVPYFGACICSDRQTTFPESTPMLWPWYRNWPSPNYEVSIEHLRRVWHASKELLPFRTPGFAPPPPPPPFKDLRMLQHLVRPVFRADWKTWHLYWRHFLVLWNRWKRNWMKLDRKQVLKLPLPIMGFEADRKTKITALADPSTKMAHCTQVPCKLNIPMLSVTVMEKIMTSSNVLLYPRPY